MNLLVDIGNSRVKWAYSDGAQLHEFGAHEHRGAGDFAYIAHSGADAPTRVVAVSTVPMLASAFTQALRARWGVDVEWIAAQAAGFGIVNRYTEPARLGADRWALLVGARRHVAGAVCAIDCGTALTFNVLDADGHFLGGAIMPGLSSQLACLQARTAGVQVGAGRAHDVLARNTEDAVAAGIAVGSAGAVARIVGDYRARVDTALRVLVTGGDAARLQDHLDIEAESVPDLVLRGLAYIAANAPSAAPRANDWA